MTFTPALCKKQVGWRDRCETRIECGTIAPPGVRRSVSTGRRGVCGIKYAKAKRILFLVDRNNLGLSCPRGVKTVHRTTRRDRRSRPSPRPRCVSRPVLGTRVSPQKLSCAANMARVAAGISRFRRCVLSGARIATIDGIHLFVSAFSFRKARRCLSPPPKSSRCVLNPRRNWSAPAESRSWPSSVRPRSSAWPCARKLFDKWLILSRSQSRVRTRQIGLGTADANTVLKVQIFRDALTSFEARLAELDGPNAGPPAKQPTGKPKAARAWNIGPLAPRFARR